MATANNINIRTLTNINACVIALRKQITVVAVNVK
jgi:hypothetical protein